MNDNNDKRNWFPETWQISRTVNENYFHSLWLGVYYPAINLWVALWQIVILGMCDIVRQLFIFFVKMPFYGLTGNLSSHGRSRQEVESEVHDRYRQMIINGMNGNKDTD